MIIMLLTLYRCDSDIGRQGGPQNIIIGPGCIILIPAHEIFHALGRWHEHTRPDRDNFIEINWDNIEPGNDHHRITGLTKFQKLNFFH